MASWTRWTAVCANSGRRWCTGKPGMLWSTGSLRLRHDWVTERRKRAAGYAERKAWCGGWNCGAIRAPAPAHSNGPPGPWPERPSSTQAEDSQDTAGLPGTFPDPSLTWRRVLLWRSSWPLSGWVGSICWPAQRQGESGDDWPLVKLPAKPCLQCVSLAIRPPLSTPQDLQTKWSDASWFPVLRPHCSLAPSWADSSSSAEAFEIRLQTSV